MFSQSKFEFFQGKCKWAKLTQPDLEYDCWSIVLYPDTESYNKILALKEDKDGVRGLLNVVKKDEDGYYVSFKRKTQKLMRGKVVAFSPPEILEADGKTPLRNTLVGNGSDVTVKVELYKYNTPGKTKGLAARLMSVRVDKLIPYEMNRDFDDDQKKLVKGLDEQPEQLF